MMCVKVLFFTILPLFVEKQDGKRSGQELKANQGNHRFSVCSVKIHGVLGDFSFLKRNTTSIPVKSEAKKPGSTALVHSPM
jgi:hypothetical protein